MMGGFGEVIRFFFAGGGLGEMKDACCHTTKFLSWSIQGVGLHLYFTLDAALCVRFNSASFIWHGDARGTLVKATSGAPAGVEMEVGICLPLTCFAILTPASRFSRARKGRPTHLQTIIRGR